MSKSLRSNPFKSRLSEQDIRKFCIMSLLVNGSKKTKESVAKILKEKKVNNMKIEDFTLKKIPIILIKPPDEDAESSLKNIITSHERGSEDNLEEIPEFMFEKEF